MTKTKYSINYTFSETFKDGSSTRQIFMLLALRSCQKWKFVPIPLLPSWVTKLRASISRKHNTVNFSEVAALLAQDMLHKEILMKCSAKLQVKFSEEMTLILQTLPILLGSIFPLLQSCISNVCTTNAKYE